MSPLKKRGAPKSGARVPRVAAERRRRQVIYAVVEGEGTERDYLEYLEERYAGDPRTFEINVIWERNGLKPRGVVRRALETFDELDDPKREQVWAFFDRDEHNHVEESYSDAADRGINVAFSHPSFDLWLLLHFVPGPPGAQGGSSKRIHEQLRTAHPASHRSGPPGRAARRGVPKAARHRAGVSVRTSTSLGRTMHPRS
jgi:hypothetical protein